MDAQKVDNYLSVNNQLFSPADHAELREALLAANEEQWNKVAAVALKTPKTAVICGIWGNIGLDRFYLGETGMAFAKLCTCGGLGIWTLIDLFKLAEHTRQRNYALVKEALA